MLSYITKNKDATAGKKKLYKILKILFSFLLVLQKYINKEQELKESKKTKKKIKKEKKARKADLVGSQINTATMSNSEKPNIK